MAKLTMVNVLVLSLSTKACLSHFVVSWGSVSYLLRCFILCCLLYKLLIFIVLITFMLSDSLKVNSSNAACIRLICVFMKTIISW